jgi:hypothetical protein
MRSHILSALPYPVQLIVGLLAYRKVTQTLYGQGTGRFSTEEISSYRRQVWENIDALLVASRRKKTETGAGDAMFWVSGGNEPSEADTALFGFITAALVCNTYVFIDCHMVHDCANVLARAPETKKVLKSLPAVVDYAQRIHDHYFPDYVCWE